MNVPSHADCDKICRKQAASFYEKRSRTTPPMKQFPPENIFGHTKKLRFIDSLINRQMAACGTPITVLDFGCGNGQAVSRFLIRPGVVYHGVDIHPPSLEYARRHFAGPDATFHSEVPSDTAFDLIVYADVIEHLDNPVAMLSRHHGLLKDNGMIVGAVPNGYGWFENEKRLDRWFNLQKALAFASVVKRKILRRPPLAADQTCRNEQDVPYNEESGHVQFFTKGALERTLRRAGFEIGSFRNGAFAGALISERYFLHGERIANVNARVADFLPSWAVSTWYFVARKSSEAMPESARDTDVAPPTKQSGRAVSTPEQERATPIMHGKQRIDRTDVTAAMRRLRLLDARDVEIECDSTSGIFRRDMIELYLLLSRVGNWTWVDERGGAAQRQPLARTLWNVARDLLCWPALHTSVAREVGRLERARRAGQERRLDPENRSVLFIRSDPSFNVRSGGSVGHLAGVIGGLRKLGHHVNVASSDYLAQVPEDDDFHVFRPVFKIGGNLPTITDFLYSRQLARQVNDNWTSWKPSFIYQRYSMGNYAGVLLQQQHAVPYVCEYNGSFVWMARHWSENKLIHEKLVERIELLNLNAADLIVAVSKPSRDELVERGIDPAKILVNPNGVNPQTYSPDVDGSAVRKRHALEGKTVIGFIGTMGPWHGAEVLAEAFGRLLRESPDRDDIRLMLIGDGVKMGEIREVIERHNASRACILTGIIPQDQGPAHLAACDILASPHVPNPDGTAFFGSPTKLFEYMATGRGIVASRLDQIGEILEHDRTAWMVEPGDAEALKEGLKHLIDNPQTRDALGEAARREAIQKYSWTEHVGRIVGALDDRFAAGRRQSVPARAA